MRDGSSGHGFTGAEAELAALAERIQGPVLLPGAEGFAAELSGYQTAVRNRPDVIVGAAGEQDVRAAVAFAATHRLPVSVQAGGHGLPHAAAGGVLVSTRRMTGLHIDARARTARVGAGVSWGRVIEEAAPHGLAPLSGSHPGVCAVSYVLGGGLGLMARRYGYACDHVRSLDVVTADGRLLTATAHSEPDLFWALRGGGGNFGVVTGMEIDLFPVSHLYGGRLVFGTDLVEDAVNAFSRWADGVPEEMTAALKLVPVPDLAEIPPLFRGKFLAMVLIGYIGDAAEAERLIAPLRAVGPRLVESLGPVPYTQSGTIHDEPDEPHILYGNSFMLSGLDAEAVKAVLASVGADCPVSVMTEIRQLGGALSREPAVPSAVGHRSAAFALRVISSLEDVGIEDARPVHRALDEALSPWTVGRSLNFVHTEGDKPSEAQVRSLYTDRDFDRLARVKAHYDPDNAFRFNFNIPPARESR